MDRYGVIGNPIHHSLSPQIHQLFAEQTLQQIDYQPILVELNGLAEALSQFACSMKGLNVTLPFKQDAFQLVHSVTPRAKCAGAVNTIRFDQDGKRWGDNTDGVGFIRDVKHRHQFSLHDKRILMLGAGGAVRGVLSNILQEQPSMLMIANRTEQKANLLANEFSHLGAIEACTFTELKNLKFDMVINATSASLKNEALMLPTHLLNENAYCYDMVYRQGLTPFLQWAKTEGAAFVSDGIGMLIEQAAESFYIWRGIRPGTNEILAQLKNHFKSA